MVTTASGHEAPKLCTGTQESLVFLIDEPHMISENKRNQTVSFYAHCSTFFIPLRCLLVQQKKRGASLKGVFGR